MINYYPKIVRLDANNARLTFELHPVDAPDLTMLRRTITLSPETMAIIDAMATETEKFNACRAEMLKGNGGFQADWLAERAAKQSQTIALLDQFVGHSFPVTTEEELAALNATPPEETDTQEVIF